MLPITQGASLSDRTALRMKDAYLQGVLEGRNHLVFDGAMGSMLQAQGLAAGEIPELLCLTEPAAITGIHRAYVDAGAQAVTTNTFGANARKLGDTASVDDVFEAAINCARESGACYVAADIGPTGALLEPLGTLPFDEAYELFSTQARAAERFGADLIIIETMTDLLEAKAAVLAAKEHTSLPIFATMTFDETGRTFLGTDPITAATTLCALGVQAVGVNCSLGPKALQPVVADILSVATCPVIVQANAGMPQVRDGQTVYSTTPSDYLAAVRPMIEAGAVVVGGCCGTTPDYIALIASELEGRTPCPPAVEPSFAITSAQQTVALQGHAVAVIGERINPTGRKKLREALIAGNLDVALGDAIAQTEAGADILDVNAGLPDIDEVATLRALTTKIQAACTLPLQLDSADPEALEAAVRCYAGKPLVNSVNGKAETLDAILPIVKHYGCAVVGLTLDEDGIPPTAEQRVAIAERIVAAAERAGIPRRDVLIDCLAMSTATNQHETLHILDAIRMVKERLGVRTVLGVSNISFGLPARSVVNATFLAGALSAGLDMPILNPLEPRYREVVDAWRVLNAQDEAGAHFIARYADYHAALPASAHTRTHTPKRPNSEEGSASSEASLHELIVLGNKGPVASVVERMLQDTEPMQIIEQHLIPALDDVGARFEAGTFFLPQLMASAEAAKVGFDVLRPATDDPQEGKGKIVLATVKGDIHDIGKNIVKMLLQNYGYQVIDLGRDVDVQKVVDAAREHNCKLVGLSALMTTTVKHMEETIRALHEQAPDVQVMVGGAVLTEAYAQSIGADFYAKDAAESARFAGEVLR